MEEIVSLWLIRDAASISHPAEVKRLSKYSVFSDAYEGDLDVPETGSREYQTAKLDELTTEGNVLEDKLINFVQNEDVKNRYI